jgi:hypothetical protein
MRSFYRLSSIVYLLACSVAVAQSGTEKVLKYINTNALTESLKVPTGKTLTIESGGTLNVTGATLTGFPSTSSAWADITGKPTNVTAFGNLSNAAGLLTNNGSGTLTYTATTTGGNGETDAGKLVLLNSEGALTLGSYDNVSGNTMMTLRHGMGTTLAIGNGVFGHGVYSELNGAGSAAFHAHVTAEATGNNAGFQGDVAGGTGVNYLIQGIANSTGYFFHGYEYTGGTQYDRYTIDSQGDHTWYANGTTLTTGTNKTSLIAETPSGTAAYTLRAGSLTGYLISTADTATVTNAMLAGSIDLSKLDLTGTPDGTKYLRDDGSWQSISLSGYLPLTGGTLTGPLAITGGTVTASAPPLSITQTFNGGSGVTHRGVEHAFTNTSSNSASTLLRLLTGASASTVAFSVNAATGATTIGASSNSATLTLQGSDRSATLNLGAFGSEFRVGNLQLGSANVALRFTDANAVTRYATLYGQETDVLALRNGSGGTTGAAWEMLEMTAPGTPSADRIRLYVEDNGSGKSRLVVKWTDGTTSVLATQP